MPSRPPSAHFLSIEQRLVRYSDDGRESSLCRRLLLPIASNLNKTLPDCQCHRKRKDDLSRYLPLTAAAPFHRASENQEVSFARKPPTRRLPHGGLLAEARP